MSEIHKMNSGNNAYFYAVFTTSENIMTASAICVFYMNDIMNAFDGAYNIESNEDSVKVPEPRPSTCPTNLTYEYILFTRKNILMKNEINSQSIIIESGSETRYTKIAVDFNVKNVNNDLFDVLFVATGKFKI